MRPHMQACRRVRAVSPSVCNDCLMMMMVGVMIPLMMMMMMTTRTLGRIADGSPGLVDAARAALGWVTGFIAEEADDPSFSKEHALRILVNAIQGRGPLTTETYEQATGEMWAGLGVIVSWPGGTGAFQDADGDSWALTMFKTGPLHVKVCFRALKAVFKARK
jgi:hypothetical protein